MAGTKGRRAYIKTFGVGNEVVVCRGVHRYRQGVIESIQKSDREQGKYNRKYMIATVRLSKDKKHVEEVASFGFGTLIHASKMYARY